MTAPRAIVNVPAKARKGEIIAISALIGHVMENGFRYTTTGVLRPRDIITSFVALYNGEEIFSAQFFPAVAANPFISFHTVATESGTIELRWTGDNGFAATHRAKIAVE
ncbi:MAG: thiosulfate oxidation carrier complex protein SoxZ [Rhodospirillales bacterium]|jgi:sulfur-oxidizing protein SoxZ|nr:thiosulfate oxidation carrier complex protein SoxZ [Rhodospirillales bacterium]